MIGDDGLEYEDWEGQWEWEDFLSFLGGCMRLGLPTEVAREIKTQAADDYQVPPEVW